ncbi:MAG: ABC transporter permease [Bacteroidales bacterium]|nr:ABC transporter permease [Bacteroidales bacterium]
MNFPFYIAKRYLFSKKKHNAINIISGVSVCGVALATMALVCTLSVFNGFRDMVATFFTAFDPELKITVNEGKVFNPTDAHYKELKKMADVKVCTLTLEENAMVQYKDRQTMAVIKGVQENFEKLTSIDSILIGNGLFMLHDTIADYGIMGVELVSTLGCGVQFLDPLQVYVPKRDAPVDLVNPSSSFNMEYLYSPGVVFAVKQRKYDSQYIITSLAFARHLLNYNNEVSAIELKLMPNSDVESVKAKIEKLVGPKYSVKNRYEQQEDVFQIMKIEKFISYLFLTFILMIACFNVIGSLSMLILDKKDDVATLRSLGANDKVISRIFLFEGRLISVIGAVFGILLGLLLCYLQQKYGLIQLGNGGDNFIVKAYPVSVHAMDIVVIFFTVIIVGFLSVWYPVRYLSKKMLKQKV